MLKEVSSWSVSCWISCKIDGCTAPQMPFMYFFIYFASKIPQILRYGGFFLCRDSSVTLSESSRRHAVETDEREFMWLYPGVTVNRRAINTHRHALCLCGSPTGHMKNSSLNTSSPSYKYTSPQCICECVCGWRGDFLEWTRMPTQ